MDFYFGIMVLIIVATLTMSIIKVLPEWERGVVLRFGHLVGLRGPGLIILIPGVERLIRVDTRTVTMDVQPQDIITRDNISMKVNAVVYFRVTSPSEAITKVENYYFATSQLAQTTLRSILGQFQMDDILTQREQINQKLQEILDQDTEPWGIKITKVELKHIDLPPEMQRAMARQAEAERERRAKVISAEGELQRSEKLAEAAKKLNESSGAIMLAYLHSLQEIAGDKSNTIVFPVPLNLLEKLGK